MTKSFVLLRPQFLVEKGELQMKAWGDSKTSNIYKERERDDVLYSNEKERRCTKSMKHDILAFIFGCL